MQVTAICLVFKPPFERICQYNRKDAILSNNAPLPWFNVSLSLSLFQLGRKEGVRQDTAWSEIASFKRNSRRPPKGRGEGDMN